MKNVVLLASVAFFFFVPSAFAHPSEESIAIERARVLEVRSQSTDVIPGTQTNATYQTLTAEIMEGPRAGTRVTVENDYLPLKAGDQFYATHSVESPVDTYTVLEPYRLPVLEILVALFLIVLFVFGGIQGLRGLVSLIGSLVIIFYVLLPGILAGYSPVLLATAVSAFIVVLGSYITHGIQRTTTAAVLGMLGSIGITGALAWWAVHASLLSGYSADEVTYLHFSTNGSIDFVGLLLGGIMIGLLGILYDAAIGQAIAVEELKRAGLHYSSWELYRRAQRIGREHIGALVNTLAIAYVGVSLPLLLFLHFSDLSFVATINQELFATEIIRTMVGSIGLILAVPLTTVISIWMLRKEKPSVAEATEGHSHTHGA